MASHRRPAAPSRTRTRITALSVVAATSVGLATQAAQAAPQPTTGQLKAQLDQLNNEAEKQIEAYNAAHDQQTQLQARVAVLQDEITRNQAKANTLLEGVGSIAQSQYASGAIDPTVQLMLTSDPSEFLAKAGTMNQISSNETAQLAQLAAAEATLAKEKAQAEAELQTLAAVTRQAAALKAAAAAKVKATQQLLDSLTPKQRTAFTGGTGSNLHPSGAAGDSVEMAAFAAAKTRIGDPYHWGSKGPNEFDCSGLMMWAYAQAGMHIGGDTYEQLNNGTPVNSLADLRIGDLVFFNGGQHVGMWAGGGVILHAPHTGALVRMESISTIGSVYAMRHL